MSTKQRKTSAMPGSFLPNTLLHKLAATMMVLVGVPFFLYDVFNLYYIVTASGFLQQCLVTIILLCTKKVCNLCKEHFLYGH